MIIDIGAKNFVNRSYFNLLFFSILFLQINFADDWLNLEKENFIIHYHQADQHILKIVIPILGEAYNFLYQDFNLTLESKVKIYICSTSFEFDEILNQKMGEQIIGVAFVKFNQIVLRSPRICKITSIQFQKTIIHELTHLFLGQIIKVTGNYIPLWFNEGLAMYETKESNFETNKTLGFAAITDSLIPLEELNFSFPKGEKEIELAYAESQSMVNFFISQQDGRLKLENFLNLLKKGEPFEKTLKTSFGKEFFTLQKEWLNYLNKKYKWLLILISSSFLWFIVSLLFLLAYFKKKQNAVKKHREWALEELWEDFSDNNKDKL